jgi:hypothetical protein
LLFQRHQGGDAEPREHLGACDLAAVLPRVRLALAAAAWLLAGISIGLHDQHVDEIFYRAVNEVDGAAVRVLSQQLGW